MLHQFNFAQKATLSLNILANRVENRGDKPPYLKHNQQLYAFANEYRSFDLKHNFIEQFQSDKE